MLPVAPVGDLLFAGLWGQKQRVGLILCIDDVCLSFFDDGRAWRT